MDKKTADKILNDFIKREREYEERKIPTVAWVVHPSLRQRIKAILKKNVNQEK